MNKITIMITDDHTLLRETWAMVLSSYPEFEVVAECGSGEEAVETAKKLRPDVVLMDINLPGMSGMEATQLIRKFSPGSKILCVSQHTQPSYLKRMFTIGAIGYLTKNSSRAEMYEAIKIVRSGNRYICKDLQKLIAGQFLDDDSSAADISSLSVRELEIIGYIRKGYSSKEIASSLNIATKTIEVHRHNILKKLNLKNTVSLVNLVNAELPG